MDKVKNWLLKIEVKRMNLNGMDVVIITESAYEKLIELITSESDKELLNQ